jgi:hypothetical protein
MVFEVEVKNESETSPNSQKVILNHLLGSRTWIVRLERRGLKRDSSCTQKQGCSDQGLLHIHHPSLMILDDGDSYK